MCTITFQCDSTSPLANWLFAGATTTLDWLSIRSGVGTTLDWSSIRYSLNAGPNNFRSLSEEKQRANKPAAAWKRWSADIMSAKERVLRPKVQLYPVAWSMRMRAYQYPPTETQSSNMMSMWTASRQWYLVQLEKPPHLAFGMVA
jgi:hypothetical protein